MDLNKRKTCSEDLCDNLVIKDFKSNLNDPEIADAVAAIKALSGVIKRSTANTMMELEISLTAAADKLKEVHDDKSVGASGISVSAGCDLFLRYVTRCFLEFEDFDQCKRLLIDRGERFASSSLKSRNRIADLGHDFVRDGMVVFTYASSRVVISLLCRAAKTKHFSVIVSENRPDGAGYQTAEILAKTGIPTTIVLDTAIGYIMEKVDIVIVGAEGVVENGGIVNKIGTYSCAMIAKAMKKPFYVAAESYKFARLYPLNQQELPDNKTDRHEIPIWQKDADKIKKMIHNSDNIKMDNPSCDYTPPEYITLLFTDLGVLTPSAVSDELIKLYQ